jgi:SpoVK/Ycf46/Vps4 family AAA+-type ATPase
MYVVDWDLPTREEIRSVADTLLKTTGLPAPENIDTAVDGALGLTLTEVEQTFAKSVVSTKTLDVATIIGEKKQILKKGGILEYYDATGNLTSVGGHGALKDWLKKRKRAFTAEARKYGLPLPKGTLVVGVPGSGKSLIAKILGNVWGMPTLRLDMGRVFAGIVGSSEENMRKVIAQAEACAPCVLWLDELEKGLGQGGLDGGTSTRVLGTFLTWMQDKTKPVFVLATANDVSRLPPELLRKGRFDEIWFADLPNLAERKEIFEIHLKGKGQDVKGFAIDHLAELADGFTGAEIESAVVSAMYDAFDVGRAVNTADIRKAIESTVPLSRTRKADIDSLRQWAHASARATRDLNPARESASGRKIEIN